MSTNDGGTTWQMDMMDDYLPAEELMELGFSETGQGYAAGNNGLLLKTELGVGIPDNKEDQHLMIYPNPARDILNISYEKNVIIKEIAIYNQVGQKVFEGRSQNNTIDVSGFQKGIYIIEVIGEDWITSEKVIVY